MARGDERLFPRGGVWWPAFCIDGVEKRESLETYDEAEVLIPMPSMARKNIPASKTHIICAVFIGRPAVALGKVSQGHG